MATAKMQFQPPRRRRDAAQNREAALRLLQVERSSEVLPVLLDDIIALGYARAAVLETRPNSHRVGTVASVNWPPADLAKLAEAVSGPAGPLATTLATNRPEVLEGPLHHRALSIHPMLYSNPAPCREAASAGSENCLAVQNAHGDKDGASGRQPCSICGIQGYAVVAMVEHRRHKAEADSAALTDLIRLANAHLSRLVRVDHYCDRIGELEAALVEKDVTGAAILEGDLVPNAQASTGAQNKAEVERRMLEIERFASAGRLAATIAHEVNNPMEAIKNAVYLLAGSVPESALPVYNILKSETERVARVVRQMLGLYRHTEPVKPVSVNTIIEDTLLLLSRQLQLASVQVETELGMLPDAFIAPDQIRQVLYNLVINARDAMPNGGRLRIRSRHVIARDQASNWIRILVADTGAGIPREIIPDIFEPFVTTKGELGTGLGLWIVKGIIQSHTGTITVRSKVGRGTVFRIDLPIAKP